MATAKRDADGLVHDPAREQQIDHVWKLAATDARANRDPQALSGELADLQHEYDVAFTEELIAIADEKESN